MPSLRTRVLRLVAIAVGIQAMFVFFFVFPGHDPEPNGLPVGVVGPPVAARALADREDGFDVTRYSTQAAAREAILDREVYGAFVFGPGGPQRLLTAQAASFSVWQLLQAASQQLDVRQVQELRPLDPEDPRGASLNLFILPVIITSILGALIATQLVPDLDPRGRVLVMAGIAALAGLVVVAIVNLGIGAIPGPWLAEAGLLALAVFGLALTAGSIIRLAGPPGTFLAFALFLMIGNPASGLATAPELLPTPWKEVGGFLPPGAVGEAVRNTAYFDAAAIALPVAVLLGWVIAGAGLTALAHQGPAAPDTERAGR